MTDAQPEFLTVAQAAALLQVSKATVRRWLEDGTLPGLKLRREWRIHRPRLIATLDTETMAPGGDGSALSARPASLPAAGSES